MEKKFYILTEVGEYTPDQFIGKQWVKAFDKWELSEENEKKDNEFEKYLKSLKGVELYISTQIYVRVFENPEFPGDEMLATLLEEADKYIGVMLENFGGGDDSYFDYVPDLSEQIQMLLYQIPNCPEKDALIEKWEKGIRQEYLADDNNEYIEDENELQEMIQWMRSKVIGRNRDQVLTCKNVLEAWDEFNKEDHE
jgi:hypothetical protein|uniref:Uncharacterized protein n=1 Tax=Ackermannviridae sp. ctUml7 TaxID=2825753 RepID=A0A8S5V9M1_9CAUD|nr:MAG TPA: hypothetical protein [Ackermannviridae sp. ctUml7]